MKTNYLLPSNFKRIGWIIFLPVTLFGILWLVFEFEFKIFEINVFALVNNELFNDTQFCTFLTNNILDEVLGVLIIVSSIFIAFSKEKFEDEYISKIRLESLVWATYINYLILIIAILFVYEFAFLWVLVFNMFTILFFFIIRFNWVIIRTRKSLEYEK